jgi:hypothetical protein
VAHAHQSRTARTTWATLTAALAAVALVVSGATLANPSTPVAAAPVVYDHGMTEHATAAKPVYKRVTLIRCLKYRYYPSTRRTKCLQEKKVRAVPVRFIGKAVHKKNADGKWTRIPYVWSKTRKAVVYSHFIYLQLRAAAPKPPATPAPSPAPSTVPSIPKPPTVGVSPTPTSASVAGEGAGKATSYSFMTGTTPANAPHWDKCQPIRWALDLTRATEAGSTKATELARWKETIEFARRVTGYTFVYVPGGDGKFPTSGTASGPLGADLTITYASENDPGAYRSNEVAGGVAGSSSISWSGYPGGQQVTTSSEIVLDYAWMKTASLTDRYNLFFHELGHSLGLGHVSDTSQVMNPYISSQNLYRLGDRTGLWKLAQNGCV